VVNFFEFLAQEVREYLAALGFRSIEEAVGQAQMLDMNRAISHWKADGLDLSPILAGPVFGPEENRSRTTFQDHELEKHFDHKLIAAAEDALKSAKAVVINLPITNVDQAVGTMLGN
jgi:glutamate synthase (NADPH/NADH) large chain